MTRRTSRHDLAAPYLDELMKELRGRGPMSHHQRGAPFTAAGEVARQAHRVAFETLGGDDYRYPHRQWAVQVWGHRSTSWTCRSWNTSTRTAPTTTRQP